MKFRSSWQLPLIRSYSAESILPNQPLRCEWVARDEVGTLIDSSSQSRFFADLSTRMIDSVSICLKVVDTAGNACGLCDTFTFRDSIEHWRPFRNNKGNTLSIYELYGPDHPPFNGYYDFFLGRDFRDYRAVPSQKLFIHGRKKKIKVDQ